MLVDELSYQDIQTRARGWLEGFIGREWLVERVRAWRERPDGPRFLLILGEAGIGKSAFAAHLWLDQQMCAAAHFCIAGRGGTIEPLEFVRALSAQLEQSLPGFAEAKRQVLEKQMPGVNIKSTVQTGEVHPGAKVTGVDIHLGALPAERAFDLLLRRPLRQLEDAGRLPPLTLLVDALDEALTYSDQPTIPDLLRSSDDFPAAVRWVLTSRRIVELEAPLEIIQADSPENQADVRRYLESRRQALQPTARRWGMDVEALFTRLGEKSEWNFLYLSSILPLLSQGEIASPEELPNGLDGYYRYLLETRIGQKAWRDWGADLMEVVLALQEPVALETLARLLGWEPRPTRQRLERVAELLDPALMKDLRYYRHHWSVAEFLGDQARAGAYWCDLRAANRRIAEHYLRAWGGLEAGLPRLVPGELPDGGYPFRHLVAHLLGAGEWQALYHLLTNFQFLEGRVRATSVFDLEADYRRALANWPLEDERRAALQAFEERLRLEEHRIAQAPEWLFPALYNHLTWQDAPDGPLYRLCEAAAAGRRNWLRSRLDPRPEPPLRLRSLEGHMNWVNAVAVTADGRYVLSGSEDHTVKVWELASGRLLRSLEDHTDAVRAVAVTADGRYALSGSDDETVKVWELESGASRVLFWNDAPIHSLALSPDGRWLVCGDQVGRVWIFEWVR